MSYLYPHHTLVGYVLIKKIRILNANAISSPLTYGFPAISGFIGSVHALSRQISQQDGLENVRLDGVLIASHHCQVQRYRESKLTDFSFMQTRNPILKSGKTASIVEEGRCHLVVSLVVGVYSDNPFGLMDEQRDALLKHIEQLIQQQRIAGGSVVGLHRQQAVEYVKSADVDTFKHKLLPAFVLMEAQQELHDITAQLQVHHPAATSLDALIETATLHHIPLQHGNETSWHIETVKRGRGWIVPIPLGFQGISPQFAPYEMTNCRNPEYPSQYVEAIYGLGRWQFPHRIDNLAQALWYQRHIAEQDLYVLTQNRAY